MPTMMTVGQVAAELGMHRNSVLNMIARGAVRAQRHGKAYAIPRSELQRIATERSKAEGVAQLEMTAGEALRKWAVRECDTAAARLRDACAQLAAVDEGIDLPDAGVTAIAAVRSALIGLDRAAAIRGASFRMLHRAFTEILGDGPPALGEDIAEHGEPEWAA